jgi:hypothetical protein
MVSFSADHGYTGDASTVYIDSGFNPSTAGGNFSTTAASLGIYQLNSRATGQIWIQIGNLISGGTLSADIFTKLTDGNTYGQFN